MEITRNWLENIVSNIINVTFGTIVLERHGSSNKTKDQHRELRKDACNDAVKQFEVKFQIIQLRSTIKHRVCLLFIYSKQVVFYLRFFFSKTYINALYNNIHNSVYKYFISRPENKIDLSGAMLPCVYNSEIPLMWHLRNAKTTASIERKELDQTEFNGRREHGAAWIIDHIANEW